MAPEERDEMRSGGRNYMPREQRRKKQVGVSECTSSDEAARTKKKASHWNFWISGILFNFYSLG